MFTREQQVNLKEEEATTLNVSLNIEEIVASNGINKGNELSEERESCHFKELKREKHRLN